MRNDVKIFMCTHKEFDFLPPGAVAVAGGAKQKTIPEGAIPDYGDGGSISEKNPEYCELTVQYYAWKNEDLDAYGFCHYRRFLSFAKTERRPYLAFGKLLPKDIEKYIPSESEIKKLSEKYDIILPRAEDMGKSVYAQYSDSENLFREDIDLFVDVLKKRYPFLADAADEYLQGTKQYFCNMFIMKRDVFFEYSEWLFSLLFEFDNLKKKHGGFQKDRTDGYLAERFLGIYVTYARKTGKSIYECLRIDTERSFSQRVLFKLFPPESKRRFLAKKILNRSKRS